ncbi:MAG: hypothetical protein WCK21_02345 [Actinomycetota bacterium]
MTLDNQVHLGQQLDEAVLDSLADFICGDDATRYPEYRSSSYLTRFFQSVGIDVQHDGSTRKWWVLSILRSLHPPFIEKVILRLVDLREYKADKEKFGLAFRSMNDILSMEDLGVEVDGARGVIVRATPLRLSSDDVMHRSSSAGNEADFLGRRFDETLDVDALGIESGVTTILQARIEEARVCAQSDAHLASIFLLGSTLEGLLLGVAYKDLKRFMTAGCAPKAKDGKAKNVHEWKLAELIDVYHEVGVLGLDVKKFSHVLRDFRNYIHPYQQMTSKFTPDQHTVDICWQVFKAAFAQLADAKI